MGLISNQQVSEKSHHTPPVKKAKAETTNKQGGDRLELPISKEYYDLAKVFSKRESDTLPPHRPTDCAIEIMPGAKLPKPKLHSLTLREMEELHPSTTKN